MKRLYVKLSPGFVCSLRFSVSESLRPKVCLTFLDGMVPCGSYRLPLKVTISPMLPYQACLTKKSGAQRHNGELQLLIFQELLPLDIYEESETGSCSLVETLNLVYFSGSALDFVARFTTGSYASGSNFIDGTCPCHGRH